MLSTSEKNIHAVDILSKILEPSKDNVMKFVLYEFVDIKEQALRKILEFIFDNFLSMLKFKAIYKRHEG